MNKTIGVFFGSRNPEHDISIITAQLIISGLKGLGYNTIPVYIDKKGQWLVGEELGKLKSFTSQNQSYPADYSEYDIDLKQSIGKLVLRKKGLLGKAIRIDIAFPAFHGAYGEDGSVQGLFEMFNVSYVGCGIAASAIAMDKALTKEFFRANDIPTTKFVTFSRYDWEKSKEKVIAEVGNLKWPLFVKPVHLGSSIGISKVNEQKDLADKVEVALFYDDKVLVEEGITDLMDVTCCLIGNNEVKASLLQESVFQSDLFNFDEKYLKDGGGQLGKSQSVIIPARLDESETKAIQEAAKKVFLALGCTGIARVDFLYDKKTKEFFANEINPLPGTLYHHLWEKSGVSLNDLLEKLIADAEERYLAKEKNVNVFKSSVLSKLGSSKLKLNK